MDIKPVYTLEEVQEILGISRPIALMMIREKKLIIHQLGMKRFVLLEDLVDYIGQLPRAFVSEAMSARTTKANVARKENVRRRRENAERILDANDIELVSSQS